MTRIPLTLRALVLVPLLAAGIDQARVSLVCDPGAQSCLESAGQGRFGITAMLAILAYMCAIGILVARLARGRRSSPTLWIVATAGLWAACGGQAMLGSELGGGAAVLGGGWTAGAVLRRRRRRPARVRAQGRPGRAGADALAAPERPAPRSCSQNRSATASRRPRTPHSLVSPASRGIAHRPRWRRSSNPRPACRPTRAARSPFSKRTEYPCPSPSASCGPSARPPAKPRNASRRSPPPAAAAS